MSPQPHATDQPFQHSPVFGSRSDLDLVRDCLAGDPTGFDALVLRYQRVLYNVALRMLDDPDDALDAVQSAFVKAYERLHSFDPGRRFFSWLYRIAVNEALSLRQQRRPRERLSEEFPAPGRDAAQQTADHELERLVQDALQELTPVRRDVVVLRHFAGLSYREISELLDIPEKTVKSRLFDARRRLADLLAARGVSP